MTNVNRRWATTMLPLAMLWLHAGCNDQVLYRESPSFQAPPANAGEFLGYSGAQTKKTTCGNCHSGKQALWEKTGHAHAWSTLQASGRAEASCEGCHSVSSRGNQISSDSVGWVGTKNVRYQDVQCESCHGPGLTHSLNPDAPNKPLASLSVGVELGRGCGECHSGSHRPFVEEWAASRHSRVVESRHTNPSCNVCHDAKEVLKGWGVKSTFIEDSTKEYHAVTCAVCHDPHDATNPRQLRFRIDVPVEESNLCMKCHHKRGQPDLASPSRGPHSPEGPLLIGDAGWLPPNFQYPPGALVGSHGSDRNPRLCATCHVNDYQITDQLTGAFSFRATGHSFQAIPCVSATGVPTGSSTCEMTERSFRACTSCHLAESAARTALIVAEGRLADLAATIGAQLAQIPAAEFSTTDNKYTTAEGAKFNQGLALKKGSAAHNPFLVEALLRASIKQIELDYGIKPSADVDLRAQLAAPPQ